MEITLSELAALVDGRFERGDSQLKLTGVASVTDAQPGDITFFANPKYIAGLRASAASVALVPEDFAEDISAIPLRVKSPSIAFASVAARFAPAPISFPPGIAAGAVVAAGATVASSASIGPNAVIESGAFIGENTVIGAGSYVGHGVKIGTDSLLYPNVSIRERCVIGNRVIIHCGAVVGSDGFGFEFVEGRHRKIPQIGIVQIDDEVEIGANVTIDRARFGRTWIQEGAKIDNLVQIAHNVVIGKHAIIVAQTGISGSSSIGMGATLAGQVGVVGHIRVGNRAIVAAQSGVSKDVPDGEVWFGYPAGPMKEMKTQLAYISRLGKLVDRVKQLEARIEKLSSGSDGSGQAG